MEYYINPTGNDDNNGTSQDTPWQTLNRLNRHLAESAQPGDRCLLRAGGDFAGTLTVSCPFPVEIGRYDGDARPVIHSGTANGLELGSDQLVTGTRIWGIRYVGTPTFYGLHAGIHVGGILNDLDIEDVEASGYGLAGILFMGHHRRVRVADSYLHGNSNGLFTSPWILRNFQLLDTEVVGNDLHHPSSSGFGVSINYADGVEVAGCKIHHNGLAAAGGGSGLMMWMSRRFNLHHNQVYSNRDGGVTDGQGIVADDCWAGSIHHNECIDNVSGIDIHDDSVYTGKPPHNVAVYSNYLAQNMVGLCLQMGGLNRTFEGNEIHCDSRDGAYRTAIDLSEPNAGIRFRGNRIQADNGAWTLTATDFGPERRLIFDGDGQDWRSNDPRYLLRGIGYRSLAEALEADAVFLANSGLRTAPVQAPTSIPSPSTRQERHRTFVMELVNKVQK